MALNNQAKIGRIVVSQSSLHPDTNRDLLAMYNARRFSPRQGYQDNFIRASLGMDCETLNDFYGQFQVAELAASLAA